MYLAELVKIQQSGSLVIGEVTSETAVVGGNLLTHEQCGIIAERLGWTTWDKKSWEIIDKTNKFIKGLAKHLTNMDIINGTTITFLNRRISNSMKYFDRIKIEGNGWDLTILYGMPGSGGTYALYDGTDNNRKPAATARSLKQLIEIINTEYN